MSLGNMAPKLIWLSESIKSPIAIPRTTRFNVVVSRLDDVKIMRTRTADETIEIIDIDENIMANALP